jgi:hypothetical protein
MKSWQYSRNRLLRFREFLFFPPRRRHTATTVDTGIDATRRDG